MDDATAQRHALADELKQRSLVHDAAVEAAFRVVPRHLFVPGVPLDAAYSDQSIATKTQGGITLSSSSQPAIMAIMLEQLALQPGENVLEIGAGTGFNAALLSQLVGAHGRVTSIDVDEDIVTTARDNLARAGFESVNLILADGGFGYAAHAPYDAILATVGVWDLSPYWLAQLRDGGRLVVPLQLGVRQFSIAFEGHNSQLVSYGSVPCGFLPMRGAFASPVGLMDLEGVVVQHDTIPELGADMLRALLAEIPATETLEELRGPYSTGLPDYIALRGGRLVSLFDRERKWLATGLGYALIDNSSLALLALDAGWDNFEPTIRIFGGDSALRQLREYIARWIDAGRPDLAASKITVMPLQHAQELPDTLVVRKKWMEYHIQFENRE